MTDNVHQPRFQTEDSIHDRLRQYAFGFARGDDEIRHHLELGQQFVVAERNVKRIGHLLPPEGAPGSQNARREPPDHSMVLPAVVFTHSPSGGLLTPGCEAASSEQGNADRARVKLSRTAVLRRPLLAGDGCALHESRQSPEQMRTDALYPLSDEGGAWQRPSLRPSLRASWQPRVGPARAAEQSIRSSLRRPVDRAHP